MIEMSVQITPFKKCIIIDLETVLGPDLRSTLNMMKKIFDEGLAEESVKIIFRLGLLSGQDAEHPKPAHPHFWDFESRAEAVSFFNRVLKMNGARVMTSNASDAKAFSANLGKPEEFKEELEKLGETCFVELYSSNQNMIDHFVEYFRENLLEGKVDLTVNYCHRIRKEKDEDLNIHYYIMDYINRPQKKNEESIFNCVDKVFYVQQKDGDKIYHTFELPHFCFVPNYGLINKLTSFKENARNFAIQRIGTLTMELDNAKRELELLQSSTKTSVTEKAIFELKESIKSIMGDIANSDVTGIRGTICGDRREHDEKSCNYLHIHVNKDTFIKNTGYARYRTLLKDENFVGNPVPIFCTSAGTHLISKCAFLHTKGQQEESDKLDADFERGIGYYCNGSSVELHRLTESQREDYSTGRLIFVPTIKDPRPGYIVALDEESGISREYPINHFCMNGGYTYAQEHRRAIMCNNPNPHPLKFCRFLHFLPKEQLDEISKNTSIFQRNKDRSVKLFKIGSSIIGPKELEG